MGTVPTVTYWAAMVCVLIAPPRTMPVESVAATIRSVQVVWITHLARSMPELPSTTSVCVGTRWRTVIVSANVQQQLTVMVYVEAQQCSTGVAYVGVITPRAVAVATVMLVTLLRK